MLGDQASASAEVVFVVPEEGASPFGATSPAPAPQWLTVARHLAERIPGFDDRIHARVVLASDPRPEEVPSANLVVALGVRDSSAARGVAELGVRSGAVAVLCHDCAPEVQQLQRVGSYQTGREGLARALQASLAAVAPWSDVAVGERLSDQARLLLGRNSSEDLLYALFFVLHQYVLALDLVRYTVNPTWEKGPLRNGAEFASMCACCSEEIFAALSDAETKATIDLLNACDMRDQVGSYRVIVSYETPQLEAFSECILQRHNCFGCDADILPEPRVPLLRSWRGAPLDAAAARHIFIGHYDCADGHPSVRERRPWSWKVVAGANPAYDAFPCQHQVFYPSKRSTSALWYDPVFKVETLDGRSVWTKRHYRCTPREVAADVAGEGGSSAGAWTLTTLDNGVVSKEHWTTVDAADDLSWAVFHYSGAAAVVGQSYLGGLLCTADGQWPAGARAHGPERERIEAAFRRCGIEMWELYGHGPSETGRSFMWTEEQQRFIDDNPPPLEPIGDQTVQAWRKAEKAKMAEKKQTAVGV